MSALHIIVPILVGGIIGYCTNYIAIKMLFRPYKAKYIGKWRIPFTPGIIPKNQKRVANAIGEAVRDELITVDAVKESLDETGEKHISKLADGIYESNKNLLEILPENFDNEKIISSVSSSLSESILAKTKETDIDSIVKNYGANAFDSLLGGNRMLAMLFNNDVKDTLLSMVSDAVRRYIDEHGEEVLDKFIKDYLNDVSRKPVGETVSHAIGKEDLTRILSDGLKNLIASRGEALFNELDVKSMVSNRIEAMEMDELEELVLSVMKQELQAVINLGAVIGAIIGIINIFL